MFGRCRSDLWTVHLARSETSCQWPVRKPLLQPQFSLLVTGSSAEVLPEIPGETLNWNQMRAALGFLTHILCEQAELL